MPNEEINGSRCREIRLAIREVKRQMKIVTREESAIEMDLGRARLMRNQKSRELTRLTLIQNGTDAAGFALRNSPASGAIGVMSAGLSVEISALEAAIANLERDIETFKEQIKSKQRYADQLTRSNDNLVKEGGSLNCVLE